MERTLGPRNIGDLLRQTFTIYGKNFLRFITIGVVVIIPILIILFAIALLLDKEGISTLSESNLMNALIDIPFSLIILVAGIVLQGAMIHAVSQQYFIHPLNIGRAFAFSWRRTGVMLGAQLLVYLAVLALCLIPLLAIVAIYLYVKWFFIFPIIMLEGRGPVDAMSRSSWLVDKNWWRIFGISLLLGLILAIIIYTPSITVLIMHYISSVKIHVAIWMATFIWFVVGIILAVPIGVIGLTLLYFYVRSRKEAFDLNDLAKEQGLSITAPEPTPIPPQ